MWAELRESCLGVARQLWMVALVAIGAPLPAQAALPELIAQIKPSLVIVGTFSPRRNPQFAMRATGFAVADGRQIVTNVHALPDSLDLLNLEVLAIAVPQAGGKSQVREVRKLASDAGHDLAVLQLLSGAPLPALTLGNADAVREGQAIAFSGFPLGEVLGGFAVTHRGIVSAIAPTGIPGARADRLDAKLVRMLSAGPFDIFQLDATAYPGHSGSPVWDAESGAVIGVINSVWVKGTRESALSTPTGITYAIPVRHVRDLLDSVAATARP